MTANLYLFNSGIGDCEFIFVFASRKDLSGAGHKGNQISSAVTRSTCSASQCKLKQQQVLMCGKPVGGNLCLNLVDCMVCHRKQKMVAVNAFLYCLSLSDFL